MTRHHRRAAWHLAVPTAVIAAVAAVVLVLSPPATATIASPTASTAATGAAETVSVTPSTATQDDGFNGTGSGFTPSSTVSDTVLQPDGHEYAGSYTHSHAADSEGDFTWGWVWTRGDPLGTYTFVATDVSGASASTTFTITASTGPPAPAAGSTLMFDASSTPSVQTMGAWGQSPYESVGVYVPVDPATDNRHDKQQVNLSPSWVSQVGAQGCRVVPIYVGRQAPTQCGGCAFHLMSTDAGEAHIQGEQAAGDAARSVAALGVPTSTPVFYDLEGYGAGASAEVTAYLDGWVSALHAAGRLAGVYGPQRSTMADLSAHLHDAAYHEPDDVWVATDNRRGDTTRFSYPPDDAFTGHRMNQFHLDVDRTYGGDTLTIDETAIDDAVLTGTPPAPATPAVRAARPPAATLGSSVRASWSGSESGSYVASYDVRVQSGTDRARLSAWTYPSRLQATSTTSTTASLPLGATWCYQVRSRDVAGRVSGWTSRSCTTRPLDDRALSGSRVRRLRVGGALRHTVTRLASPQATTTLSGIETDRVGLLLSGRGNGRVTVTLGGRTIGRLAATNHRRSPVVWFSLPRERAGTLVVHSQSSRPTDLDGVLLRSG